jgi:hypothetical protein
MCQFTYQILRVIHLYASIGLPRPLRLSIHFKYFGDATSKKLEIFSLAAEISTALTLLARTAKLSATPVYLIVVGVKPFLTHHS